MELLAPWSLFITLVAFGVAWVLTQRLYQIGTQQHALRSLTILLRIGVWLWVSVALIASSIGFFESSTTFSPTDLSGFVLFGTSMTVPVIGYMLGMRWSTQFRQLIGAMTIQWLVGLEVYRIGGVIFLVYYVAGHVPSWWGVSTGIADLIIGVTALPIAWGLARATDWAYPVAIVWNLLGLADIMHAIGYVCVIFSGLSSVYPAPALIGQHPLALIALFQAPLALIIHGIVLRRLISKPVH